MGGGIGGVLLINLFCVGRPRRLALKRGVLLLSIKDTSKHRSLIISLVIGAIANFRYCYIFQHIRHRPNQRGDKHTTKALSYPIDACILKAEVL